LKFKKTIVRVCLDGSLFYGVEGLTLKPAHIQQYESARLQTLRTMRGITGWGQQVHHVSGNDMLAGFKMGTCMEKISRHCFGFWGKTITSAPMDSYERMLLGTPVMQWVDGVQDDGSDNMRTLWADGRPYNHANWMAKCLEQRAIQLYYYAEVLKKPINIDYKLLLRKMLMFEGTQMEMTDEKNWMDIIKDSPKMWLRAIKFGQFEPINEEESEADRRRKRQNYFAPTVPTAFITNFVDAEGNRGRAALKRTMRGLVQQ
jgi:hypothetical protein